MLHFKHNIMIKFQGVSYYFLKCLLLISQDHIYHKYLEPLRILEMKYSRYNKTCCLHSSLFILYHTICPTSLFSIPDFAYKQIVLNLQLLIQQSFDVMKALNKGSYDPSLNLWPLQCHINKIQVYPHL